MGGCVGATGSPLAPVHAVHRLDHRSRSPARSRRRKRGAHPTGRSRGGLTSKVHAVVDQDGLPVRLCVTEGQASDKTVALTLIPGLPASSALVGDRAYDAKGVLHAALANGTPAHVPTQRDRLVQRTVPHDLYAQRNLVERFFNQMKHCRRAATRYDKFARNYLAAVSLIAARLWCRHVESTT